MPASARNLMRTAHSTLCRISSRPSHVCRRLAWCRSGRTSGCGATRSAKNPKGDKRARGRGPMTERALIGQQAREFCNELWQRGDFWNFENSEYERARCAQLLTILAGRRYTRALEIGCGAGYFTRLLAGIADQIVAFDIAPAAIARARTLGADLRQVEFRVANAMDYEWRVNGPWDLVVCSDTICYLGWVYTFFDVAL